MRPREKGVGTRFFAPRRPKAPRPLFRRQGLTLLEVLLSVTIFLFALVAIGALFSWGHQRGADARDKAQALRLAQSKLAEVVVGAQALSPQADTPYGDLFPGFSWAVDCSSSSTGIANLYDVRVTVTRTRDDGSKVSVTLAQLVFDPTQKGSIVPSPNSSSGSSSGSTTTGGS
jgi:type II secretory pathway pseudopilin PulG